MNYYEIGHPLLREKLPDAVLVSTRYMLAGKSPWGQDPNQWDELDNYAVMSKDLKMVLSVGITQNQAVSRAIFLWSHE